MIYNGQGPIFMGDYDTATGKLKNLHKIGCGNRSLNMAITRSTEKIKESCSGSRATLSEYETEKSMNITLEMQQFDREMLAIGLYGDSVLQIGDTVSAEELPTVAVDDYYQTEHPYISDLVLTDSTPGGGGGPTTLTKGTHYAIEDAEAGLIKILDLGALTQPFKAAYTFGSYGNIATFAKTNVIRGLLFAGKSTADGTKVNVFIPRIQFAPTDSFDWLGDSATSLKLTGEVLYNDKLASTAIYGGFARVTTAGAS